MDILVSIGKFLLVALAVTGVAHPLYAERHNYRFAWQVYKRFRFGAEAITVQGSSGRVRSSVREWLAAPSEGERAVLAAH